MRLTCVRHGRTAWNHHGRFAGSSDIPLDEVGRAQAAELAQRLAHEHFDLAFSSDLQRARDTAAAIAQATGVAIRPEPRLREMRFGAWEGLTWAEIVERGEPLGTETAQWQPPGGESYAELRGRVQTVLGSLLARTSERERVLLVSHSAVMHAILELALGTVPSLSERLTPGAILRLHHRDTEWALETIERPPVIGVDCGAHSTPQGSRFHPGPRTMASR